MSFLSKTSDSHYKLNTIVVFLLSIFFVWFFFYCKHDFRLSKVNVFNVDPYDGVGSIGVTMITHIIALIRFIESWINYSSGIVLAALYFSFCC
jgi:hypothetical protein